MYTSINIQAIKRAKENNTYIYFSILQIEKNK